ncbi:MFS transporter [Corynebacterium mendelii]|uniref:MFS transporter n=1 Tax=Corynebacterium mendelii TaxID=2765362 RepID=A0A939DZG5_9CORY|nr:MFS transporter [Corynebacterium mendelii]MBN9643676.1 MFS transporter [Corynebacterium mendelii]
MTAPHQPTAPELIDRSRLTGNQKQLIALTIVGNVAEFFDLFLIGFVILLLVDQPGWQLTGTQIGVIGAASGVGTVIGAILWGRLADTVGRKHAFISCIAVLTVFTAATVTVQPGQWLLLAGLRVGVCIGVGGLNITSVPYVQEFVPARQRGLLSGLTSVFIPLGLFLGAVATATVGDAIGWRGLVALGCLPVLLMPWAARVPESPRFLLSAGQRDRARAAYGWALEIPAGDIVLPGDSDRDRRQADSAARRRAAGLAAVVTGQKKALAVVAAGSFCFLFGVFAIQSWGQLLMNKSFGMSATAVGVAFMVAAVADIAGRFGCAWFSDRAGRRAALLIWGGLGAAGCLLSAAATWLFAHGVLGQSTAGAVFFTGIVVTLGFGDGAFGILNAFGAEQFSTATRSTGVGLGYGIGATAKIIGPYTVGVMVGGNPTAGQVTVPFVIFAALFTAGALIYQLAEETRGQSLSDLGRKK